MQDMGSTGFKSMMEEERQTRVAEYKGRIDAANNVAKTKIDIEMEGIKHKNAMEQNAAKPVALGQGAELRRQDGSLLAENPDEGDAAGGGIPKGLTSAQNAGRAALTMAFGGHLDSLGNPIGISDDKKEPYLAANALKDQYVANGMHPGEAAVKAFTEVMGEEPMVPLYKAEKDISKEAEDRDPWGPNALRPGAMKEAYGPEGDPEKWKTRRLEESQQPKRPGILNRAIGGQHAPATTNAAGPQPGAVVDGFRFKGGNPNDPTSWEPAQ